MKGESPISLISSNNLFNYLHIKLFMQINEINLWTKSIISLFFYAFFSVTAFQLGDFFDATWTLTLGPFWVHYSLDLVLAPFHNHIHLVDDMAYIEAALEALATGKEDSDCN